MGWTTGRKTTTCLAWGLQDKPRGTAGSENTTQIPQIPTFVGFLYQSVVSPESSRAGSWKRVVTGRMDVIQ